jgi:hypothetical protein
MRYIIVMIMVLSLTSCGFFKGFQKGYDNELCISKLDFAMGGPSVDLYSKSELRSALDQCKDIKTKTNAVKKAMAKAEVCLGEYDEAKKVIKQFPDDLAYLKAIIAAKQAHPGRYKCLTNMNDKACEKFAQDAKFFKNSFSDCKQALSVCNQTSDSAKAKNAASEVKQICAEEEKDKDNPGTNTDPAVPTSDEEDDIPF